MVQRNRGQFVKEKLSDNQSIVLNSVFNELTDEGKDVAALAPHLLNNSFQKLKNFYQENMEIDKQYYLPGIDVIHSNKLSYEEFSSKYMMKNLPLLIEGIFDMYDWPCADDWVLKNGSPNIEYIRQNFGDSKVTCTDTSKQICGQISQREILVNEYLDWWETKRSNQEECLYIKDWHLAAEVRTEQSRCENTQHPFYQTPEYFKEDWLNEYFDSLSNNQNQQESSAPGDQQDIKTSDYRFVYMGPKGSWTALHADVFRSFSWSINVCGLKRWRLLPPQYTYLLHDQFGRDLPPTFDYNLIENFETSFPNLQQAYELSFEVIQNPGSAIFVPSGWYHTVENLEDTISINHNWFNQYNIDWVWDLLKRTCEQAGHAIRDCRQLCTHVEFQNLVQKNVFLDCGMDLESFYLMLEFIAQRDILALEQILPGKSLQQMEGKGYNINDKSYNQIVVDGRLFKLRKIEVVLRDMRQYIDGIFEKQNEEQIWYWIQKFQVLLKQVQNLIQYGCPNV